MRLSLEPDWRHQTWSVPECPFPIESSAAVLDEIRIAAVDAFLSLPHGGAEIGGVLWGTHNKAGVRILAAHPLECEHALGPTFTLSDNDHTRLRELLAEGCRDLRAQGLEPVGWYHSHTRSEIFLSAQDVEIHNRYFPGAWQVALVVRPHLMQPVRAGFFFRGPGGAVHADASYGEFVLEPLKEAAEEPLIPASPPRRSWRWLWWLAIPLMMALSAALFPARNHSGAPFVSLIAYDLDGQLQIQWDRAAVPMRSGEAGTLEIADGASATVIAIDGRRLRRGTVSYSRENARVDVHFTLAQPGIGKFEEWTTFVGHPPPDGQPDQAARTLQLERDVAGLRWLIRQKQIRKPNPR